MVERDTIARIEHFQGTIYGDRLTGNDGANILLGNGGADILSGGAGDDRFVYEFLDSEIDTITDFDFGDRIVISAAGLNADLTPNTKLRQIFSTTGLCFSSSTYNCSIGTAAIFFYETATGILSFDPDGTDSASSIAIAQLSNLPTLTIQQLAIVS